MVQCFSQITQKACYNLRQPNESVIKEVNESELNPLGVGVETASSVALNIQHLTQNTQKYVE